MDLARSRYRTYRMPFHSFREASKMEQYLPGKTCIVQLQVLSMQSHGRIRIHHLSYHWHRYSVVARNLNHLAR